MNRRHLHWLPTAALLGVISCLDGGRKTITGPEVSGGMPAGLVSDGAHAGVAGFYFLPPVVAQPTVTGVFDPDIAALQPVVAICEVTATPVMACGASTTGATPALRTFSTTSSPPITLDGDKYKVDWDTGEPGFEAGRLYRVFVLAGQTRSELGYADALLSTVPGQVKNTDGETIVLRDGRTLPIHFRIEQGVILGPGPASSLQITGLPETSIAGATASITVTALDASGNVATGYAGTIAFTSTDAQATLPPEYTFTAADAGTHTFPAAVVLRTAGSTTVTVTDQAVNNVAGARSVTVTPAAAAKLVLEGIPSHTTSGTAHDLTVTARDEFENTATGYTGTVQFTSSDAEAALPDAYEFQPGDAGVKTFAAGVTLKTAGAQILRAQDDADERIFYEIAVTVASGNAATLQVTGLDEPVVAGVASSITVTARDANGNVASGYTGTIAFTSNDPLATLPAEYTFTSDDAGTHAFATPVVLRTAGSVTVTATDQAVTTVVGDRTVTVTPAAAATLVLDGVPASTAAGVAHDVIVMAKDEFGNIATGYTGTAQFTSSDPAASLPAAYAFQSSDAGTRTFAAGVIFRTAAAQSLQVTDAATPSLTISLAVSVAHGPASQLRFTTQPASVMEGTAIAPPVLVTAYDAFDNIASAFAGVVSMAIGTNPSGGVLSGTIQVNAALGIATFSDLRINAGGNGYTLVASGTGLASATSDPFNIIAIDVHWINASGGLWSNGANWSSGAPPAASQNAFIDLSGTYAVTLDVNAAVSSITVGAASGVQSLSSNARTLTVVASGTVLETGRLTFTNSQLNGAGPVVNDGIIRLVSSQIANSLTNRGTFIAELASAITGALTTMEGSVVQVRGSSTTSGTLTVASGFSNEGKIELTNVGSNVSATLAVNSGTLVNAAGGTIHAAAGMGGGIRIINAQLDNRGAVRVDAATTLSRGSADHVNSGLIDVSGGNLTLTYSGTSPSFTNNGTITVASGRTWSIGTVVGTSGASFRHAAGATLNGGGAMTLNSTPSAVFETGFTLSALSLSSTTASFTADISTSDVALTLNDAVINGPGTLTNPVGETLTFQSTTINAPVVNGGTMESVLASAINGPFTAAAGSLLKVRGVATTVGTLNVASGFTNEGTIELTSVGNVGATLVVHSGPLVNAAGGTIRAAGGAGGTRTLNAHLDNRGTMRLDVPTTLTRGGADHVNIGVIEVNGGDLTLDYSGASPSFTNSGTITVVSGRTFAIRTFVGTTAPSFRQAAGATLNGGGAMAINFGISAAFETGFTLSALSVSGATVNFAADITTAEVALALNNAVINGPGTLTNPVGETLTFTNTTINAPVVNGGTLESVLTSAINGQLTAEAGSVLRVLGSASTSGLLNVASGFTNEGTIELTNVRSGLSATLVVHSGPLVNAAGGTIHAAAGAGGGFRTLNAHFDNRGTMRVDVPTTLTRGSADHVNTGLIELNANLTMDYSGSTPTFTNSGTITIAAGRSWTVQPFTTDGNRVIQTAGATMTGGGTFDPGTVTAFTNAGSVTLALVRIGDGFVSTGNFAPTTAEFYGAPGSIPVGAGYTYNNVRVLNAASFTGSVALAGSLTIVGSGSLNIGGNQVSVGGNFATQNSGVLTMQNGAGLLNVDGDASFGGGSTNTRLTAGTLRVGGNFAQAGNAAAFAPSSAHLTVLDGAGAQTVSFGNPGTTTALSHFHRLEIENTSVPGVTLASAVFANGQLRTPAGSGVRTVTSTGHTLQVAGLDAAGLVFDNTLLRVVNGEALARFDDVTFRNMNVAATQLRLDRSSDAVTFNNVTFDTPPTTGLYLHLVDTDSATPVFTITMQGAQPAVHGGFVLESTAGQLLGWPMS